MSWSPGVDGLIAISQYKASEIVSINKSIPKGYEVQSSVTISYALGNQAPSQRFSSSEGLQNMSSTTRTLIDLQTFDGSFALDLALAGLLGISQADLEDKLARFSGGQGSRQECLRRAWATILAVRMFEVRLTAERAIWQLVVDKANTWVRESAGVSGEEVGEMKKLAGEVLPDPTASVVSGIHSTAISTPLLVDNGSTSNLQPPRAPYLVPGSASFGDPLAPSTSTPAQLSSNSAPLVPVDSTVSTDYPDEKGDTARRLRRPFLLLLLAAAVLAIIVLAVVLPVYFTVIKHKRASTTVTNSPSNPGGNGGGGGGGGGHGNSHATSGGDGSTVTTDDGSTFIYHNKFGGYCASFSTLHSHMLSYLRVGREREVPHSILLLPSIVKL